MKFKRTICVDEDVNEKLEKLRNGKTQFYSHFVNNLLREKFNLNK